MLYLGCMIVLTIIYAPTAFDTAVTNYASNSGQRRYNRHVRQLQEDYNGNGSGEYYNDTNDSSTSSNVVSTFNPITAITLICIAGIVGLGLATLSMGFMISFAEPLIKVALIFNIITFGILALVSLLAGNILGCIMFGVSFLLNNIFNIPTSCVAKKCFFELKYVSILDLFFLFFFKTGCFFNINMLYT
jgi:hypothetical protein